MNAVKPAGAASSGTATHAMSATGSVAISQIPSTARELNCRRPTPEAVTTVTRSRATLIRITTARFYKESPRNVVLLPTGDAPVSRSGRTCLETVEKSVI